MFPPISAFIFEAGVERIRKNVPKCDSKTGEQPPPQLKVKHAGGVGGGVVTKVILSLLQQTCWNAGSKKIAGQNFYFIFCSNIGQWNIECLCSIIHNKPTSCSLPL